MVWIFVGIILTPCSPEYNPVEIFWRWVKPKMYGFSALGGLNELVSMS